MRVGSCRRVPKVFSRCVPVLRARDVHAEKLSFTLSLSRSYACVCGMCICVCVCVSVCVPVRLVYPQV
jgi:hypothetical protein